MPLFYVNIAMCNTNIFHAMVGFTSAHENETDCCVGRARGAIETTVAI
jgi:hypothetical protein